LLEWLLEAVDLFAEVELELDIIGSRGFLVPIDLRLALPIALIKSHDKVLQCLQGGGFSDAGDLVLQLIREIFVKLAGKRLLIPTGLPSVAVKVNSILCRSGILFSFLKGICNSMKIRNSEINLYFRHATISYPGNICRQHV